MRRVIVLTLAVLAGLPALAQKAKNTEKPLALMVRRTLHDMGKDALMPPTLSSLLGLTPHPESVAVKQVAAKIRRHRHLPRNPHRQNLLSDFPGRNVAQGH